MASSLFGRQNSQRQQMRNNQNDLMPQLIQAARSGKDPRDVLPGLARQYPVVKQAMEIISGNAPEQVTNMIQSMAAERGATIGQLINMLGIR